MHRAAWNGPWIGDASWPVLLPALSRLMAVSSLAVERRRIGAAAAVSFAAWLHTMTCLRLLRLAFDRIDCTSARNLTPALPALSDLQELGLVVGKWERDGLDAVLLSAAALPRLIKVDLSGLSSCAEDSDWLQALAAPRSCW
jgi:hypothetical protein